MDIEDSIKRIDEVLAEHNMPKRVRRSIEEVKDELNNEQQDLAVRVTSSIYSLDDIATDVNLPMHTKTVLWDLIGMLESLKVKGGND
ncbi:MAG: hypothetical protein GF334_07290 [Candidatus Altiarchaeales archaeon]|nr:hypothetical protein [Candidatus Altiarchaeales archaeon]